MRHSHRVLLAGVVCAAGVAPFIGGYSATAKAGDAVAELQPVNDSDASGLALVEVQGTRINVTMGATGLVPLVHAAHIHFGADALHECPTIVEDDANTDGRLATLEGAGDYGPVRVSLTTTGDTSPASALAVDRFGSADADGDLSYYRGHIKVDQDVAKAIVEGGLAAVVIHGVDYNGDPTTYGFAVGGASDLNPELPAEATDPAVCGILEATP